MRNEDKIVFGIGWNRTGTRTLTAIFQNLNIKASHWGQSKGLCRAWVDNDLDKFEEFILKNDFGAFSDAPWCFPNLYKFLYEKFPNAKFILTTRSTESWIESYKNLYERHLPNHKELEKVAVH